MLLRDLLIEKNDLWSYLKDTTYPIYIYGMGDGAEKIINHLQSKNIPVTGIFSSDDFFRKEKQFRGFTLCPYTAVKKSHPHFIALMAFAVDYEPMLSQIKAMAQACEFYAPDVPVVQEKNVENDLFDYAYFLAHEKQLNQVYEALADDLSQKTFLSTLNYKLSGKIQYLYPYFTPMADVYDQIIQCTQDEIYVDLGAYNGDTVSEFIKYSKGKYREIYAFEPDRKNFSKLLTRIETEEIQHINPLPYAAWHGDEVLCFEGGKGGRNSRLTTAQRTTQVVAKSLDGILEGNPATIIKFDVEGAELQALEGCKYTMETFHPKILMSAYHRNTDLFLLPQKVLEFYGNYKIYFRHQPYIPAWETNFYFV